MSESRLWRPNNGDVSPLSGVRVLDFTELLPGPFLTQNLVELGADVLKVERPPHGDNVRRMAPGVFASVNRGKRSILLDLKSEGDVGVARTLAAEVDVLVEGYRPGALAKFGLDYTGLSKLNSRLIYVSLTGYGQTGPWSRWPGHDVNYLAASGALALSGEADGAPANTIGLPVADLASSMYGLAALLAALYQRQASGRGQHLDVAIADCMLHWMNPRAGLFAGAGLDDVTRQRRAVQQRPAYGTFRCCDGRFISIAAMEDHFWGNLNRALDLSPYQGGEWKSYQARTASAARINARLAEAVLQYDCDMLQDLLIKNDVPAMAVIEPNDLRQVAHFSDRQLLHQSDTGAMCRFPVKMFGQPTVSLTVVPLGVAG